MWDDGCEMLDVKCWMLSVECGHAPREYFSHGCHSSGIASLNRINGKGNAYYQHCPPVTKTLPFEFQSSV